jgi:hypothetical protein
MTAPFSGTNLPPGDSAPFYVLILFFDFYRLPEALSA